MVGVPKKIVAPPEPVSVLMTIALIFTFGRFPEIAPCFEAGKYNLR